MTEPDREAFEKWIRLPPIEERADRFPNDSSKYAWLGQYKEQRVQLAWEAWQEATKQAKEGKSK